MVQIQQITGNEVVSHIFVIAVPQKEQGKSWRVSKNNIENLIVIIIAELNKSLFIKYMYMYIQFLHQNATKSKINIGCHSLSNDTQLEKGNIEIVMGV